MCLNYNLLCLPALPCESPHKGWCQVLSSQQCVMEDDAQLWQVVSWLWHEDTHLEAFAQYAGLHKSAVSSPEVT